MEHGEKLQLRTSVRDLVEFVLRSGDIDNRYGGVSDTDAMQEGSRIHREIQSAQGPYYTPEVTLRELFSFEKYDLLLEGRADGILAEENQDVCIDEIKGVYRKIKKPVPVHVAQAKCYAYMYALQEGLSQVQVQMTYCYIPDMDIQQFRETYSMEELTLWIQGVLEEYEKWMNFRIDWVKERQASIQTLEFPFPYREGQDKLVRNVYLSIKREKNLFLQAPTGVGKTISTMYPAIQAMGQEYTDRIFYLTAKTITAKVAIDTVALLQSKGYHGKLIQITAKEKLCFCEEMECNPEHCEYAKGHFDRVNDAVFELLQEKDILGRQEITEYAKKHKVCPFEMCLDASLWVDHIVCDYNYAFDPNVQLQRFFAHQSKKNHVFLVDEAHNMVERAREMFSAEIYKEDFLVVKRIMGNVSKSVTRALTRCNKEMLRLKKGSSGELETLDSVSNLAGDLQNLQEKMQQFLAKRIEFQEKKTFLDLYFKVRHFNLIYDMVGKGYRIYTQIDAEGRFFVKLFCIDPSENLQEILDKARSTIYFSGTLLPIQYYSSLLSKKKDDYKIYADSVFTEEQRLLLIGNDVTTLYGKRTSQLFETIARYIKEIVSAKKGNYMVFFPSYQMMEDVRNAFIFLAGQDTELLIQRTGMEESEREDFLREFEKKRAKSLVAFCVMGGIFGEGIDLTGDSLIGAIVVGTGIPQISPERDLVKTFFDERNGQGFDYAYRYPGMNKVQQAAGRVIRTTEDRGIVLLLDERFLQNKNLQTFPREWKHYEICDLNTFSDKVHKFWAE